MIPHRKKIASSPAHTTQPFPSRICPGTILLGQYRVGQRVGRGGQGRVYSGKDVHIDRMVAIKEARPNDLESLKYEFLMLRRADPSQVVPSPYEVIDEYASSFLIMAWIEGVTLQAYVEEIQVISLGTALHIMIQCCESLKRLHTTHIIHCDLKPGNILLAPSGVVFVDLGISKIASTFQTTEVSGTPGYIAPEQLQGRPCLASDIFSLGAIFHLLLRHVDAYVGEEIEIELVQEVLALMQRPYPGRRPALTTIQAELQALHPSKRRRR